MNVRLRSLFAVALAALAFAIGTAGAQPVAGATVQFRNDTKLTVIVQGTSTTNGMLRRGQPMLLPPGRSNSEFNVPPGYRIYSVYDANQPTQVLLRDKAIMVVPGRDVSLTIVPGQGNHQANIVETK